MPSYAGHNASLSTALIASRNFVQGYPLETGGTGLLFTGTIGVGKTHLAVGLLKELVVNRQAVGIFVDYRDLLKTIQNTYNKNSDSSELDILKPLFAAEVLVVDELGAVRPTDWVWDTVSHLLNTRYNDRRSTIITTNYSMEPPLGTQLSVSHAANRVDTLGDRIGERMRSRLLEMCQIVEMRGADFRANISSARFQ